MSASVLEGGSGWLNMSSTVGVMDVAWAIPQIS